MCLSFFRAPLRFLTNQEDSSSASQFSAGLVQGLSCCLSRVVAVHVITRDKHYVNIYGKQRT